LDDFIGVSALLANGALKAEPLITGRIGLEDIVEKGFLELINNKDENIKILVKLGE
jgi:(R,R)-butanediol dehydrogenase/meso-butanediol dehydrogenase/diacetyl reductase